MDSMRLQRYSNYMRVANIAIVMFCLLLMSKGSSDSILPIKLSRTKLCPDGMICSTAASVHPNADQDESLHKSSDKKVDPGTSEKRIDDDALRSKASAKSEERWQLVNEHVEPINPASSASIHHPDTYVQMGPVGQGLIDSWFSSMYPLGLEGHEGNEDRAEFLAFHPLSPQVRCDFLPLDFLECEQPVDLQGNKTAFDIHGYGCYKYGGQRWEDVQNTSVFCTVLPGIECFGERRFLRSGFPCLKFTGHYFLSTLLFSTLMGFLGLDRFCLGHTCAATLKLISLGGFGVWWFVDVILLITGNLMPEDGSNWMPTQ